MSLEHCKLLVQANGSRVDSADYHVASVNGHKTTEGEATQKLFIDSVNERDLLNAVAQAVIRFDESCFESAEYSHQARHQKIFEKPPLALEGDTEGVV